MKPPRTALLEFLLCFTALLVLFSALPAWNRAQIRASYRPSVLIEPLPAAAGQSADAVPCVAEVCP